MEMRLAALLLATGGNLALSRAALARRGSHGWYRFFAFELLAALVLRNLPAWFRRPLAPRQLLAWPALFGSAALAWHGFHLLRVVGRPRAVPGDEPALIEGIENTSQLVRVGAYRVVRHPLYASLLLLGLGAWLKDPGRLATALFAGACGCVLLTARAEEAENLRRFGPAYEAYRLETGMFWPRLLPATPGLYNGAGPVAGRPDANKGVQT